MSDWQRRLKHTWRDIAEAVRENRPAFLPIRHELRGYNASTFGNDLRAGLNVALLAFPQGMAYAVIAGLPVGYGIFASAIATIIGPLFAGARFITLGPTNATAVLLFTSFLGMNLTEEQKLEMMPLLLVMVGGFLIGAAFLRLASLIQFVSRTVITGYVTAAAFYIMVNQAKKVLGFEYQIPEGTAFIGMVGLTLENLDKTQGTTALLSLGTAVVFILLNRKLPALPNVGITLVLASVGAYFLQEHATGWETIAMLEPLAMDGWPLTIPAGNHAQISQMAGVAMVIAFISMLEGTSIGKSLAARAGERIDVNQQMFGMGLANVGCAFGAGMPASGSLTRSMLLWSSGAKTSLANIFSGALCAVGAFTLGPLIGHIPEAALGVLVIGIAFSLINLHVIKLVMRTTYSDAVVFVITFLCALIIRLDVAIIAGSATSILLFLRKAARPDFIEYTFDKEGMLLQVDEELKRQDPEVSIVHVEGDLFFGAADLFRDQIRRVCEDPNLKVLVLKMRNTRHLDATSALALEELIKYMNEHDRYLLLSEVRKDLVRVLRNSHLIDTINRKNLFVDDPKNATLSTAKALRRAYEIIGTDNAKVSIYVGNKEVG